MTNNQATAYAANAMEQLGYTREQNEKVQASMLSEIDLTDEKTAEKKASAILNG